MQVFLQWISSCYRIWWKHQGKILSYRHLLVKYYIVLTVGPLPLASLSRVHLASTSRPPDHSRDEWDKPPSCFSRSSASVYFTERKLKN